MRDRAASASERAALLFNELVWQGWGHREEGEDMFLALKTTHPVGNNICEKKNTARAGERLRLRKGKTSRDAGLGRIGRIRVYFSGVKRIKNELGYQAESRNCQYSTLLDP